MKDKIIALIILLSPLALFFPNVSFAGVLGANIPDVIYCSHPTDLYTEVYNIQRLNPAEGSTQGANYRQLTNHNVMIYSTSTGARIDSNQSGLDCYIEGWTLTELYTEGRAFDYEQEVNEGGGGGASYIIDVGSTVMLGGILAFLIAYWMVGLTRSRKNY